MDDFLKIREWLPSKLAEVDKFRMEAESCHIAVRERFPECL